MDKDLSNIIEKLSPIEIKVIPHLNLSVKKIVEKSGLDETTVLRALQFLSNKGILELKRESKTIIDLGTNGVYYKRTQLPERKLLITLETNNHLSLEEARKLSKLSENEFRVSIGVLKRKALIKLTERKISLIAAKAELVKKSLEEQLIEALPREENSLDPQQKLALENLQKRKDIVETKKKTIVSFTLTTLGQQLAGQEIKSDLLEEVTPEIIKTGSKRKKFRVYDIQTPVPKIYGGKKHFVNQSIEYAKKIWTDLGFKEMTGTLTQTSFWNFDALFQPQDHPARDLHDTFFIKDIEGMLPYKPLVNKVKQAHETGLDNSKGWNYNWLEKESQRVVLRTHTTCLSAQTLANLKPSDLPAKFFAIGKNMRNETVDWSHGFEFYQTEGIVVGKDLTLRHLLGYLKEFYKKMGFEKIRFAPGYFPYTEPSVEISVFHPQKKVWLELGGAGIFRPEVTIPLLGEPIPVLAWGQGFDRIIIDYYKIKDLREMYSNDIKDIRERRAWIK